LRSSLAAALALLLCLPALAHADEPSDDSGPVLGFELGVAGVLGTSGDVYRPGFGKVLVLGWRVDRMAIEWHFAQSFGTQPSDDRLRGDTTAGNISMSTMTVRYLIFGPRPLLWAVAGVGKLSVPLLGATTTDDFGETTPPEAISVYGLGPVAGGAVGLPIPGGGLFTVEGRVLAPIGWELPRTYVVPGADAPGGGVSYVSSTDDIDGVAWSVTAGVRLTL
jgi:hypothetical protein